MFGKKSKPESPSQPYIEPHVGVSDVLALLLGSWSGKGMRQVANGGETLERYSVKFNPSPDGWHIIEFNSRKSAQGESENLNVIALSPNSNEVSITEFVAGRSECTIYEVVGLSMSGSDSGRLTLQTMGWQGKHPCEIRLIYSVSTNQLEIEKSSRLTSNGGDFRRIDHYVLTRL